jgi:hypothetical protein
MRRNSAEAHAGRLGDLADLAADALDRLASVVQKAFHFWSVPQTRSAQPFVELVAHIGVEEGAARHLVALGQAQHLAAERVQAAAVAVQLVDQIFDLGAVELDALDLGGELLAKP